MEEVMAEVVVETTADGGGALSATAVLLIALS